MCARHASHARRERNEVEERGCEALGEPRGETRTTFPRAKVASPIAMETRGKSM